MSRERWILITVALVLGAIISVSFPGVTGVLIAIVVGLALGYGSRFLPGRGDGE